MGDANNSVPAPFVFSPSQAWDGNDGRWSTFIIRVGTPEQNFRVLPSIQGSEIIIPVPEGCTESDSDNCGALRGVYPSNGQQSKGFQAEASTTWKPIGLYNLILGHELNYTGNAAYGFDTVGLGLQNSGGLSLENQIVGGIATKDYYLGLFGLGPKPSNFSDFEYPQPSFMRTLKDNNRIPSLSFAYTAGASYRIPKLPGSLTLGGYDASRFTVNDNDQTFPFSADDSKPLSVGIQRITATNTLRGTVGLLSTQILSFIDSTVPHIWLPRSACDQFEAAFGLTFDAQTDLYLINDTIHRRLQDLQPSVTFALGNDNNPANIVSIQIPYGAFDLQATHPIYEDGNATNYFPIRRAANDTQYTLGRTFLQEAYVIADYERSNFSVRQALFKSSMPSQEIVSILPPSDPSKPPSNTTSPAKSGDSSGLLKPAIIGIAVGVTVVALIIAALLFFFLRRRRRRAAPIPLSTIPHEVESKNLYELASSPPHELYDKTAKHAWELESDVNHMALMSDDAASGRTNMPLVRSGGMGDQIYEIPKPAVGVVRHELYGDGEKRVLRHEMGDGTVKEKRDYKRI